VISLRRADPRFLFQLAHPRFCIVSKANPFGTVNGHQVPNASGAYQITSIDDKSISLKFNPGSLLHKIEDKIEVKLLSQSEAIEAFQKGDLNDLSFYLLDELETKKVSEKAQLVSSKLYWPWVISLNPSSHLSSRIETRRKIVRSFDTTSFLSQWKSDTDKSNSLVPRGLRGYVELPFKKSTSEKVPCNKPIRIAVIRGMPSEATLVAALKVEFTKLFSCPLEVVTLEMGDWVLDRNAKKSDFYLDGIDNNAIDPLGYYRMYVKNSSENFLKYDYAPLNKAFEEVYATPTNERSDSDYLKVAEAFADSGYVIVLGHPRFVFAYSKDVKHLHMNPIGMHLNQWWKIGRE
jgi:hypothetical protein